MIETPQENLKEEQFINHIVHVVPKDVNVKFIFDHIRNYGIAGGMCWVGAKILKQVSCTPDCFVAWLDYIAGGSLLGLGVVLFFINVAHGIAAAAAVQDFKHVRKWPFTAVTLLIILIAVKLVWFGSPS